MLTSRIRLVAFAGGSILGVLCGLAALAGAATLTAIPALFLGAGWTVLAMAINGAAWLTLRGRRRWQIAGLVLTGWSAALGVALLWPASPVQPALPAGTRWVSLPTGGRLAFLELPANGTPHQPPVIFLHGGPGIADLANDAGSFHPLAAAGYDVYLYDQLGSGLSSRLADPRGYTLSRAVANLEAFRRAIGAPRIDLVGYSWGATLAAAYLAEHADNVDKVVFVSPGSMTDRGNNLGDLFARLDSAETWHLLRQALTPRALAAWVLTQLNPPAAHAFAGDSEMDSRFRRIIASLAPALYCHPPAVTKSGNPGFYAHSALLRREAGLPIDLHAALHRTETPALVVKGQCDYLSWSSAVDYRDTLPNARLVYLPGAGHRIYAEIPRVFFAVVEAFLAARPLPLPAITDSKPPGKYRGPAKSPA